MTELTFDAIAQRRYEQGRPRKEIGIDPAILDRYVGHYKSEAGVVWDVTRKDDKLYFKTPGWPVANYALPEGEHQFFFPRWPSQMTFEVSPEGVVEHLTFHSGGFENIAHRIDAVEAEREAAILANRIKNRIPNPGSEEILRRVIASLRSGNVDFTQFIDSLSAQLQLSLSVIVEELSAKGAVEEIAFRGVGPVGEMFTT